MWFVMGVLAFFVGLIALLTTVEFRKIAPLMFQCQRCGNDFRQPPHKDFPNMCPRCRDENWHV